MNEDRRAVEQIFSRKTGEVFREYPAVGACFEKYAVPVICGEMPLGEAVSSVAGRWLRDVGITRDELREQILQACGEGEQIGRGEPAGVRYITVSGGHDKEGKAEKYALTLRRGETVCICGPTGSGKTRLLEDIAYIAAGDSPTGRKIGINGAFPSEEERAGLENRLCASLSQTMNFVLELSCEAFIRLHARCRRERLRDGQEEELCREVMQCANALAGEGFSADTCITELSGGQSRALMIADIACVSDSPVVLIDEPENAGIDRDDILRLLAGKGKLVLVSTHDPLIALSCARRIVIKNGGIEKIIERSEREASLFSQLCTRDRELKRIRSRIRNGEDIFAEDRDGV